MSTDHPTRETGGPPAVAGAGRQPCGTVVRRLARRLRFLAGITVAPLLLCLPGLVSVLSPQIHDSFYADQLLVAGVGAERRPLAEQVTTALAAHPKAELAHAG
ncbi:hypothetical protein [Pseudonocardia xishanensis]|uniref:MMPL family protein n=1 Tax=Pseudonocardia xishanensis TaxID=630995 RepID=A0ABP8RHP6_9PSEU